MHMLIFLALLRCPEENYLIRLSVSEVFMLIDYDAPGPGVELCGSNTFSHMFDSTQ